MSKKRLKKALKQAQNSYLESDQHNDELQADMQVMARRLEEQGSIIKRMDKSLTHQIEMNTYYQNIITYLEKGDNNEEGIPDSMAIDDPRTQ